MSDEKAQNKEPSLAELMAQQKIIEQNMAKPAEQDKPKTTPRKRVKKHDADR